MDKYFIANPIYDTVFKHMMENNRIARYFVETIIDQPVENITVSPHEYTYFKTTPEELAKSGLTPEEIKRIENLHIVRYDFIAIIRTPEGYRKVLIEIQKAHNFIDLMRFRTYLGEQYKRRDTVPVYNEKTKEIEDTKVALPIVTIYLLGFTLPETSAIAIRVSRTYYDIIGNTEMKNVKSEFIECLTHDSYVVQIPNIDGKTQTRLEKLLSVFEQKYFIDDKGIRKEYNYKIDDDDIRYILDLLYHTGADPEKQKEIEAEWWSNELWDEIIVKRDKQIAEQKKQIEEKDETIAKNAEVLAQNAEALAQMQKQLEEYKRKLELS